MSLLSLSLGRVGHGFSVHNGGLFIISVLFSVFSSATLSYRHVLPTTRPGQCSGFGLSPLRCSIPAVTDDLEPPRRPTNTGLTGGDVDTSSRRKEGQTRHNQEPMSVTKSRPPTIIYLVARKSGSSGAQLPPTQPLTLGMQMRTNQTHPMAEHPLSVHFVQSPASHYQMGSCAPFRISEISSVGQAGINAAALQQEMTVGNQDLTEPGGTIMSSGKHRSVL